MKILVTGGAGFIGSNLVDALIGKGHDVIIIDNLSTGKVKNIHPKAKFYPLDIQDLNLYKIIASEKIHVVYHLAAQIYVQKSIDHPSLDAQVNILGTIHLLEACIKAKVKKIIYASSAAVYGEPHYLGIDEIHPTIPVSFYGLSKLVAEHYIKLFSNLYSLNYTILRYGNVYGNRQDNTKESGVISIFLNYLLDNQSCFIFGDGQSSRDYVYVEDVVYANLHALEKGNKEIINIGTGIPITTTELYTIITEILNIKRLPIYKEKRDGDLKKSYYCIKKCNEIFQWVPQYSLKEGLKKTIVYLQKDKGKQV